jgi:CBS domain containing-hemolysin-like protein
LILAAVLVLSLIAVNAFYVGTEFALVSLRKGRIRQLAQEGSLRARLLLPIVTDSNALYRSLAACQVGITASSLVLGALLQVWSARRLEPRMEGWGITGTLASQSAAILLALAAVTFVQVLLGETVPKSIALRDPMRWALASALPLRGSELLFAGFIAILNGSARTILRAIGVRAGERHGLRSPAEIGLVVTESARVGAVGRELRDGIHNALRFATRTARDVMVPRVRVRGVPEDVPIEELRRILKEADHTRLPVYRGSLDAIVGFVHAKEVLLKTTGGGQVPTLAEMTRPVLAAPWSARAGDLFDRMRQARATLAVVLDEHGGTEGIVTLEDLVEEVLGDFEGEFDRDRHRPEMLPDGRIILRGEDMVTEVNDRYGLRLHAETAHTLGGLVMERLGRIARPGDRVVVGTAAIEVERMIGRRIETVIAIPVVPGDEPRAEVR